MDTSSPGIISFASHVSAIVCWHGRCHLLLCVCLFTIATTKCLVHIYGCMFVNWYGRIMLFVYSYGYEVLVVYRCSHMVVFVYRLVRWWFVFVFRCGPTVSTRHLFCPSVRSSSPNATTNTSLDFFLFYRKLCITSSSHLIMPPNHGSTGWPCEWQAYQLTSRPYSGL